MDNDVNTSNAYLRSRENNALLLIERSEAGYRLKLTSSRGGTFDKFGISLSEMEAWTRGEMSLVISGTTLTCDIDGDDLVVLVNGVQKCTFCPIATSSRLASTSNVFLS